MNDRPPRRKPPTEPRDQRIPMRVLVIWLALLVVFTILWRFNDRRSEPYDTLTASQFLTAVDDGRVREAVIVDEAATYRTYVTGTYDARGTDGVDAEKAFRANIPYDWELSRLLTDKGVSWDYKHQNALLWQVLVSALPFVLILGLLYFFFVRQLRMAGKGAMNFGKSRARMLSRDRNKVTFKDVAGIEEAKEEVQEIIEFLCDPKKFQRLGGRIPKGVIMMGPPGTGKTLLAKAIAGEADVPFFSISGSDFVEMFVGVGASRVRDMFEQGKKHAPCLIFIDEIDAVGRSRFSGIGGGHDEREQTLNALLVEMDGFDTQEGVIIIAATNRPDVLDPALLRPGRFDRQIAIDLPDLNGRLGILKVHARNVRLDRNVDMVRIARGTPGFSGADLSNLVNEAALLAARVNKKAVGMADFEEARDKVRWGRERRSRVMDDKERKVTAYHEAGHAIVLQSLEDAEPLHKVTIIPRGTAYLGATMQLPEKDRYMQTKSELLGQITGLMGGRSAEEIAFQDVTSGAQSDFKQATEIARRMVCEWGMSEELGPLNYGNRDELLFLAREVARHQDYSEETARKIDAEVRGIVTRSHERARDILTRHRDRLDTLAAALLEYETIDGREVAEILETGRLDSRVQAVVEVAEEKPAAEGPAEDGSAQARPRTDLPPQPGVEGAPASA